jgi:hypothetical protein
MMEIVSVENDRIKKDTTSSTRTVRGYILESETKSSKDPGRGLARSNNNNKKKIKYFILS